MRACNWVLDSSVQFNRLTGGAGTLPRWKQVNSLSVGALHVHVVQEKCQNQVVHKEG